MYNLAMPSYLKLLPAWLRDFAALHRRAAIFHLGQPVFVFKGVGELGRKRTRLFPLKVEPKLVAGLSPLKAGALT